MTRLHAVESPAPGTASSVRCLLDDRQPGRPVDGPRSRVCAVHRTRLGELLDPRQVGEIFGKPGERRVPASIPVLYGLLPFERPVQGEHVGGSSGVFRSAPPGDLTAAVLRDPRSIVDGTKRDDHQHDAALSALGTLAAAAHRLDLRDLEGRPVRWPRQVVPLAAWLHRRLDQLCAADWVDDAWHDLRRLHRDLSGPAGERAPRPLGPCAQLVDDHGRLWTHGDTKRDDGPYRCDTLLRLPPQPLKGMDEPVHLPAEIRCSGCGYTWPRHELVRLVNRRATAEQVPA